MGNAFEEECLKAHNEYRRKHGAQPLVLDREICNAAQKWANFIASRNVMQHSSGTGYGENIFGSWGQQVNGRAPVVSWYNEVKHYTYGHGFSMQTGHFTQVVWKGSQKLGVGKATGSNGWTYVVANYYPPGNYANKFRENVLPPGNYFTEEPKKVEPTVKKDETKKSETPQQQSKEPSSKEISDEIKKQIAEFTAQAKNKEDKDSDDEGLSFDARVVAHLAERYGEQYEWAAFIDEASPTAGEVVNSFSYLIDGDDGSRGLVSVVQLTPKKSDGAPVDELSEAVGKVNVSEKAEVVKEPAPAPKVEEFDQFSRECLEAHNEYRKRHGCPPLKLSKWLCNVAQKWAEHCARMNAMQHSHDHPNDNENLYGTSAPRSSIKGRDSVDCFYKEIQYYRFGRMEFSMQTGHFTAMIWKGCKELGVGIATARSGWTYVVNSYSPKANMMGAFAANVPPPLY